MEKEEGKNMLSKESEFTEQELINGLSYRTMKIFVNIVDTYRSLDNSTAFLSVRHFNRDISPILTALSKLLKSEAGYFKKVYRDLKVSQLPPNKVSKDSIILKSLTFLVISFYGEKLVEEVIKYFNKTKKIWTSYDFQKILPYAIFVFEDFNTNIKSNEKILINLYFFVFYVLLQTKELNILRNKYWYSYSKIFSVSVSNVLSKEIINETIIFYAQQKNNIALIPELFILFEDPSSIIDLEKHMKKDDQYYNYTNEFFQEVFDNIEYFVSFKINKQLELNENLESLCDDRIQKNEENIKNKIELDESKKDILLNEKEEEDSILLQTESEKTASEIKEYVLLPDFNEIEKSQQSTQMSENSDKQNEKIVLDEKENNQDDNSAVKQSSQKENDIEISNLQNEKISECNFECRIELYPEFSDEMIRSTPSSPDPSSFSYSKKEDNDSYNLAPFLISLALCLFLIFILWIVFLKLSKARLLKKLMDPEV